MRRAIVALAVAAGLAGAGCSSGANTESGAVTHESPTLTVTATISDSPVAFAGYEKGYPKRVSLSQTDIPEGLQETAFAVDGNEFAWAVAPGVWVRDKPPSTLADPGQLGQLYGECDAVDDFAGGVGYQQLSMNCWES